MTNTRITTRILAAGVLWAGFGLLSLSAAPPAMTVEEMAKVLPKYTGVPVANLTAAELARSNVMPIPDANQKTIGYMLLDGNRQPIRRFLAVDSQQYNILSFYQNGQEVYRESITGKGKQYRWLGTNGSKKGLDTDGDGIVDLWETISPEEVSREVFEAIQKRDAAKLKALVVTEKDLAAVGVPAAQGQEMLARAANVGKRFQAAIADLKLTEKAKWIHVELWVPETVPSDEFQGRADLVRHRNAGVLIDTGVENKATTFQLGEMIQVGNTWKLIDGPAAGPPTIEPGQSTGIAPLPKDVQELLLKLQEMMKGAPGFGQPGFGRFQIERAAILNQVVTKLQNHPQQELFIRQLIDTYVAAAQVGEDSARKDFQRWHTSIMTNAKGSALAGFSTFRMMNLDYNTRMTVGNLTPKQIDAAQTAWREELTTFVKQFPNIEETAEAHYRLAMAEETRGREGEKRAKEHYSAIVKNFSTHQLTAQSAGSIRRLDSEGQPMELVGRTLDGKPFDVASLKGSVVAVYYWGSFHEKLKADAAELDAMQKKYGGRLKIVTVCLDTDAKTALAAIQAAKLPGTHLFAEDGSLAANYGIVGNHIIVIGADAKVLSKNAQLSDIADAADKLP